MANRVRARGSVLLPAVILIGGARLCAQQSHTITSNLQYRLSQGDLAGPGEIVPAPVESKRVLRLDAGAGVLLQQCLDDPAHWHKDPLLFRFGHLHAFSTIGCRERSSPSMHVVSYALPNGDREAHVHFDLYGPQNTLGHATEVIRNRMTFGKTSELEVYRGLVRANPDDTEPVPSAAYDLAAHARQYMQDAFGLRAVGMATASGIVASTMHRARGELDRPGYADRMATNVMRNATAQTVEFASAAFLQQEGRFSPSHEEGLGRRIRSAAYRTAFVPGRRGDELAFPRIAAALATPWVMRPWHPGHDAPPDPWAQAAIIFGRYALRSYWAEFKPDITALLRKASHRPAASEPAAEDLAAQDPAPKSSVAVLPN